METRQSSLPLTDPSLGSATMKMSVAVSLTPVLDKGSPNGNTVIGSYGQKAPAKVKIFEVNREKEVVWEFFHPDAKAHEVHILTTNGIPVSPIYR